MLVAEPAPARQEDRIEELFRRYERRLGQFLAQVMRNSSLADDLLQETFLAVLRERDRLPEIENVEAWLFGIARNRALAALRRRRRWLGAFERLTSMFEEREADFSDPYAVRDLLVRRLPPEDRTLLVLRYVHGFAATELAAMTGRSPDAIRQQLSRACRRLAAALPKEEIDE